MHLAAAGGHIKVIQFLQHLFGERVHEKDMFSYTMLHWAARGGHCQVARYLITELKLDPQDRDKVCGMPGTVLVSKCKVYVCAWFSLCSEACCDKHVDMFMYSPVFCLQIAIPLFAYWFLFGNGSPMYSVHKLQPASNSRML